MNVVCPECKSVFRVDPAKVPEAGVRARCSVCGGVIGIGKAGTIDDDFAPPLRVRTPDGVPAIAGRPRTPARTGAVSETVPTPASPTQRPGTPPGRAAAPAARPAMAPRAGTPLRSEIVPPTTPPAQTTTPRGSLPSSGAATPRANSAPRATGLDEGSRARSLTGSGIAVPPPLRPPGEPRATASAAPPVPAGTTAAGAAGNVPRPQGGAAPGAGPASGNRPAPTAGAPAASRPGGAAAPTAGSPAARRPINPFLNNDPNIKARRLARALVSDLAAYYPDKRREGLASGKLKELFKEDIKKSWEEYVDQVGKDFAENTSHFRDALNEILAGGTKVF